MAETPKPAASDPVRVLLVTSDRERCGIREYGTMLMGAVPSQQVQFAEFAHTDPAALFAALAEAAERKTWDPEVVHLNHHAALHSGWTAEHVRRLRALGIGVVVTQHDTYETWEIMQERGFKDFRGADYLFVHERVEGLPLWDMEIGACNARVMLLHQPIPVVEGLHPVPVAHPHHPHVLGLFGFPFPWKGFEVAEAAARAAGWGVVRFGSARETYEPIETVVRQLSQCDASAFLYSTGNSGTSGAIRAGIAARRPVIATSHCRQFRDLHDPIRQDAICWTDGSVEEVASILRRLENPASWAAQQKEVAALADRDSWRNAGIAYAGCYQELAMRRRRKAEGA